jgi:mono/diheme cytochrome c family protein
MLKSNSRQDAALRLSAQARVLLVVACLLFASGCRMDMQDQPRYEVYEASAFFKDGLSSRPLVEGTIPRGYLRDDTELYTGKINRSQTGTNTSAPSPAQGAATASAPDAQGAANTAGNTTQANDASRTGGAVATPTNGKQAVAQGDPNDVQTFPFPVTEEVVNRGQERYRIFCGMCHGQTGYGDGMIVRRGFRKPPSYHTDELRAARVGHFFDVITNGWGSMPSYSTQISARDRWAIIAYIRALQLSQQGVANAGEAPRPGAALPNTGGPK